MQNEIKKINQDFQMTVNCILQKEKKSTINLHARTQIEKKHQMFMFLLIFFCMLVHRFTTLSHFIARNLTYPTFLFPLKA